MRQAIFLLLAAYIITEYFVGKFYFMEFTYSQLKQKDVISLTDGKNLGKVCDLTVSYPESNFLGITVTGCKGFRFSRQEMFIPIRQVVKIGEDTVLVKLEQRENCPPPQCPPKRPPNNCPPPHNLPNNYPPDRRSYDEYE